VSPAAVDIEEAQARIHERRLANGLRVILVERHLDPVVAVTCWYRVGARNELEDEAGVSHFLEHMMFKGTKRHGKGEVDRTTTRLGGQNNAFTSYDHTGYWFELASDRWEAALDLEADRMRNLLLDPAEFASEKAVVLEELSMGLDDPWRALSQGINEMLFERHPYRRPIIGYPDVLERMTPEDMREYYDRFYHPGNATLVIAGDIKPTAAFKAVKERFGSIKAGPNFEAADPWRPELPQPTAERRLVQRWDDNASRLLIAWPGAKVGSDADFDLDIVSTALSAGRLALLYRSLVVEQQLATSISTQNDARLDGGGFWLYAEAAQGVAPEALEAAIDKELHKLRTEGLDPADVRRARKVLAAGEAYGTETISDLGEHVGEYAVDLDWPMAFELTKLRGKVSAARLRRSMASMLTDERRIVGWSIPREARA
jgi:zinc protease